MQNIIAPVDRKLLEEELNSDRFIRTTNYGQNKIYIINHHNSPNVMREIARLREFTFRSAGGGTGEELDIDENDTCEVPYEQLIVWSEEDKEIVSGYRFIKCANAIMRDGTINLSTGHLFNFSEKFIKEYMPYTIELGRSFVQPQYQPSINNRKGLFSLDNLWDGLGAIIVDNPDMKYYFGKVTMYTHYNVEARDMLLYFMNHYFPDVEKLVYPIRPIIKKYTDIQFENLFKGLDYKEGHRVLTQKTRELGEHVPPLINQYMSLSPTMKNFGTAINDLFGDVEETAILVKIADIYESKKERHVVTYTKGK